jgi:glycosyltransferase involved in cell wall biosynthesis
MPKFSIVIPVYNGEKYVKNVVRSIQFQSLK